MMVDHYQRLGISRNASSIEIKKAYKKLALQYHPDKNKASDAHEIFKSIVESYTILSDPQRKSQYDKTQLFSGSGASSFTSTRPRPAANSFFNGFAYNASNFDAHKRKFHQQQNSSSSTFYQHFQNAFKSAYNEYDDLDNQFFQSFSHQNTRFGNPNVSSYSSQSVPKTSRYQQGAYANNYKKGEPYFSHKSKTTADSGTGTNSASHAPKFGKVFEKTDRPDIRSTKNDENWTRSKTGYSYVAAGKEAKFLRTENTTTDPSNIKHAAGPTRNAKSTTEAAKNNSPYFASTETPKKTPPTSHNHSKVNDPNIPNIFASPELDSTEQPSSSQPSGLRGSVFNTHPVGGTKTDPIVIEEEKSKKEKTPSPLEKNFFSKDNLTYTSPFQYKREAVKKEKGISSDEEKEADSHHEDHLEKENQADDSAKYDMLDALLRESANDLKRPSGSGNKRYRNSRSTTPLMKKNVFQTRFTYQNKKPTFAKGVSGRPSRTDLEIGIEDGDHDTVTPNLFESEEEESEDIEEININEDIKRNVFDVSDSDTDLSDSVNEKLEKSSEDENNPGMDSTDGIDKQPKSQTREESIIDIDPDVEVLETEEVFFADELDKQQKESSKDNKFTLHGIDSIPPFTQDKESNFDLNGMLSSLDPAATRENGKTNDKEKHFGQKKFEYIDSGATRKNVENIHLPVNNVYVQTKSSKLGLEDLFASEKILHVHPPSPPPFLKDLSKEGWIAYHEKVKRYQSEWLRYCDYINKYNQDRISSMAQRLDDMLGSVQNSEIYLQALQRDINVQEEWVFSRKQNIEVLKHYYDNVRIMRANGFDF